MSQPPNNNEDETSPPPRCSQSTATPSVPFTVISPDPNKRAELLRINSADEQKVQNRPKKAMSLSPAEPKSLGGKYVPQSEDLGKVHADRLAREKREKLEKAERAKKEKEAAEEAAINKMKAEQRRKAEQLKQSEANHSAKHEQSMRQHWEHENTRLERTISSSSTASTRSSQSSLGTRDEGLPPPPSYEDTVRGVDSLSLREPTTEELLRQMHQDFPDICIRIPDRVILDCLQEHNNRYADTVPDLLQRLEDYDNYGTPIDALPQTPFSSSLMRDEEKRPDQFRSIPLTRSRQSSIHDSPRTSFSGSEDEPANKLACIQSLREMGYDTNSKQIQKLMEVYDYAVDFIVDALSSS